MLKANCPICDAQITLQKGIEESEIISCPECHTRLVVADLKGTVATLKEAPKVEEDWGE
jgi:alpha-aminoadipate carrier protein LysW